MITVFCLLQPWNKVQKLQVHLLSISINQNITGTIFTPHINTIFMHHNSQYHNIHTSQQNAQYPALKVLANISQMINDIKTTTKQFIKISGNEVEVLMRGH